MSDLDHQLQELLRRLAKPIPSPIGDRILVDGEFLRSLAAQRDGLLGDLRMIAETTPHKQGCDEPDDSFCARCVADSGLARAEVGE